MCVCLCDVIYRFSARLSIFWPILTIIFIRPKRKRRAKEKKTNKIITCIKFVIYSKCLTVEIKMK